MRTAYEAGRSLVLSVYYFLIITAFALVPWKRRPPYERLLDALSIREDARRASSLRFLMLRLFMRTDRETLAPGRIPLATLAGWTLRPLLKTLPECWRLAHGEDEWPGLSGTRRIHLFFRSLPDSLRLANGIGSRFWFDPERRDAAVFHIPNRYHIRSCFLLNHLNDPSLPVQQRHFDKALFYRICRENGWPTIPVYASFEEGVVTTYEPLGDGPLFSKPSSLFEGFGRFERWDPEPEQGDGVRRYRSGEGLTVTQAELFKHLETLSKKHPYLLQHLLVPHRAIRELSGVDTLSTLRLPTCCFPDGRAEFLTVGYFRMPRQPGALTDNRAQGAVGYGLDTRTGRLTVGALKGGLGSFSVHPASGRTVVGFELPYFEEAAKLAVTAHSQAFASFPTLGWDIAITDDGPVLVEVNIQWGSAHGLSGKAFLGDTAYTDCVLAHMERHWPQACPT